MAGLADDLLARNATTQAAARELGRGLMRGHRPDFKLGYSWENAVIAAERMFELPKLDATELKCYLLGFALGLNETGDDAETDSMLRKLGGSSERFRTAFEEGHQAGWDEDSSLTHPAEIESAGDKARRQRREAEMMDGCGCGATKPSECAAAVEGYFTSLGQRSDGELQALAEGDGCEAARVLLVRRRGEGETDSA